MILLLTRFTARDEATAKRFGELLLRLEGSVPSEPNNLSYKVFASAEDPIIFFCLESWKAQGDADRHVAKNEADGVNKEASELLTGAPETTPICPLDSNNRIIS